MKLQYFILAILCVVFSPSTFAQNPVDAYVFTYDEAGNRSIRIVDNVMLRKGVDREEKIVKKLPENQITIYPNPAKSYFDVKVTNLNKETKTSISLVDLTGRPIFTKEGVGELTTIDVSQHVNGVYFMQITIDGHVTDWKVVKQD